MNSQGLTEKIFDYLTTRTDVYLEAIVRHLEISLFVVIIAIAIGVPLGFICAGHARTRMFITGIFSTIRIIPSLAVLFICLPIFGIGLTPALVALTFLAIPPILINSTQAFASVSAPVIETATGMGMDSHQVFWRVKLPLSKPLILTGIRIATVEVIASATLAAYIGAGGLGNIIFTGLGLLRPDLLIVGGATVAILSIAADLLLGIFERNRR